jgi:hypothetical protein
MKVGKWYVVIGNLCFGFGQPPAEYLEMLDRRRNHTKGL